MRQVREVLRLMTAATTFNRRFRSEAGAPGPSHRNGERIKNRCVLGASSRRPGPSRHRWRTANTSLCELDAGSATARWDREP